jgi:hypothetical protein
MAISFGAAVRPLLDWAGLEGVVWVWASALRQIALNHIPTVSRSADIGDWVIKFVISLAMATVVLHETSTLRMEKMPDSCQREQPD